ncbi:MAG: hypothetical protein MUF18_07185 [Fimbriiglobus sp.]|jgi:hypothetical protein|nr:hypothetical protein [Fimbriiglobus sp.]
MPLDLLANLQERLGVAESTDAPLLNQLNAVAGEWITAYCGRSFSAEPRIDHMEGGTERLFLTTPPQSITRLQVDPTRQWGSETIWPATHYLLHTERGVIESLVGPFGPKRAGIVRVESTLANVVPLAVQQANAELVAFWYRQAKTAAHLEQLHQLARVEPSAEGGGETRYWLAVGGQSRLPAVVRELLAPYRMPQL